MAESVQRIIVRRALCGQHPQTASEIITWLEDTVTGWNRLPTPFVWAVSVSNDANVHGSDVLGGRERRLPMATQLWFDPRVYHLTSETSKG